jgi:hypothetical protein
LTVKKAGAHKGARPADRLAFFKRLLRKQSPTCQATRREVAGAAFGFSFFFFLVSFL